MSAVGPVQPLTHARVLRIALPIVLSGATVPLLGIVDTGVVGQAGLAAPIGAVGVGATILTSIYWIFGFLRMGTTGLVGQAMGAGDTVEVSAYLSRALLIALSAGLIFIVFQSVLFQAAFAISPASQDVEQLTQTYLGIRIWSAPAAIAVYALTGWLIAMERTAQVLALQLVMNGVNIVLDIWFVLGLDFGVAGVAWATFVAEWSGAIFGLWLCRAAFRGTAWRDSARILDRVKLKRMWLVNLDILLRSAALLGIFSSFTLFSANLGDVTLAANQVLMQFMVLSAYLLDGFAYTAETLVARAVGRNDAARLRRAVWLCGVWSFGSAGIMVVIFLTSGGFLIDQMSTSPDVRNVARSYLMWVTLLPLLGVGAFLLDGIFIGATRGPDLRNMMILSLAIYLLAVWMWMPSYGNHGLWAAMTVSFIARALSLGLRYPALERSLR